MNNKKLKILYVGGLFKGSTGLERKKALENLGHTIIAFDTDPYVRNRNRIERSLTHRLAWGPAVWSLNRDLVEFIRDKQYDMVWVSRGVWIYPKTVKALKKNEEIMVAHYNTDDAFGELGQRRWGIFIKAIAQYDIHFVRRRENISEYQKMGAKKVVQVFPNFSLQAHHPLAIDRETKEKFGGPVGFIGDYERERAEMMSYLAENGITVRIWGPNWDKRFKRHHPNLKIEGRGLYAEDYTRAICSFDIILAFLRRRSRDLSTSRSVEIPACGAFMLAERTSEHLELFEEGKEAEFFDSEQELLNKVRYYLTHKNKREAIAKAGRQRCLTSGYDNESCMRQCLEAIFAN